MPRSGHVPMLGFLELARGRGAPTVPAEAHPVLRALLCIGVPSVPVLAVPRNKAGQILALLSSGAEGA